MKPNQWVDTYKSKEGEFSCFALLAGKGGSELRVRVGHKPLQMTESGQGGWQMGQADGAGRWRVGNSWVPQAMQDSMAST